jgi:hypothetical protein
MLVLSIQPRFPILTLSEAGSSAFAMKHAITKHQNLLKGLSRLHVLHHASKEEFFGQWMVYEQARLPAEPRHALSDASDTVRNQPISGSRVREPDRRRQSRSRHVDGVEAAATAAGAGGRAARARNAVRGLHV